MPLFIALSGMVYSLKFKALPDKDYNFSDAYLEFKKSFRGLIVPFLVWTIIFSLASHRNNVLEYFKNVARSPDWSLWFLVAVFYCRIIFALLHVLAVKVLRVNSPIKFLALLVVFRVLASFFMPNILGFSFFKKYFLFFVLGIFTFKFRTKMIYFLDNYALNLSVIILFSVFVPFWHFLSPNPSEIWLSNIMPQKFVPLLYLVFKLIVSILGIYIFILTARFISRLNFDYVNKFLSFTGKMTLGIYAIHSKIIHLPPIFFGPLLVSMLATFIIGKIPIMKSLLLGK